MKAQIITFITALLVSLVGRPNGNAQGTAFTYQGRLTDGGAPASGIYDLRFTIHDARSGGNALAGPLTNSAVNVANGLFAVTLDFGAGVFTGAERWLEIAVRTNAAASDFTALNPRQKVTAVPYALTAGDVTSANIARLEVPNTSSPATGIPTVVNGFVVGATVTSGGSGYFNAPAVTVNDATGSDVVLTATVAGGRVTVLTVNNPGSGYSSGATLTIGAPPSNAYQVFASSNHFSGINTLINPNNTIAGDGAALTSLNASQVTTGTLADARLSANVALANADSYVFVPGNAFSTTSAALNMNSQDNGSVTAVIPSGSGFRTIHAAITLPGVLFGRAVTIKEATIYYQWSNGTNSSINFTAMYRQQGNLSGNLTVGIDNIPRSSGVFTNYSLTMTTNGILSSNQAFVGLRMDVFFANSTQGLRLGGVRLRLGHQ